MLNREVGFTPNSRHRQTAPAGPKSANSGHRLIEHAGFILPNIVSWFDCSTIRLTQYDASWVDFSHCILESSCISGNG